MNDYTEENEEMLILSDLLRFADHNRNFDRKWVDNIYEFFDEHGFISQKHFEILENIYNQNNVDKFMREYRSNY